MYRLSSDPVEVTDVLDTIPAEALFAKALLKVEPEKIIGGSPAHY